MPAGTISNVEGTPDDWPCTVPMCPVNRLPAEYCEYAKKFDASKPWLMENYPDLYLQKFDKTVAELCGEEEGKPKASDDDLKKGVEEIAVHTILSGVGSYAKFEGINVIEPEPLENPDNLNPDDLHVIEPLDRSLPESEENPVSIKKVN